MDRRACENLLWRLFCERRLLERGLRTVPAVALTFDDGPSPKYTAEILRVLETDQIRATFFCVGSRARRRPGIVKRIAEAGHLIGNHGYHHLDMSLASKLQQYREIGRTSHLMEQLNGERLWYFRFPYGRSNSRNLRFVNQMGLINVTWSVNSFDWQRPGVDRIVQQVTGNCENGSVILLHDGGGDRSQTVEALPVIIAQLRSRGFKFQRIDEMLAALPLPS